MTSGSLLLGSPAIDQYRMDIVRCNPKTMTVCLCFTVIYVPMHFQCVSSNIASLLMFRNSVLTSHHGMWHDTKSFTAVTMLNLHHNTTSHHGMLLHTMIIVCIISTIFNYIALYTCISHSLPIDTSNQFFFELYLSPSNP